MLTILAVGVVLPFTPLAGPLGFTPLPAIFYLFLAGATLAYLGLVEIGKRILVAKELRG
jgi:Mg2+-importing ATPase